jgi:hypothetical protein
LLIPKIVHATWKNKDVIHSDSIFYKNCLGNIAELSPDWDIQISDDQDVEDYLRNNLDKNDYDLLLNKRIVEKIDVWRLVKLFNEGGLYVDMDKLCNTSLNVLIKEDTKLVLPMCAEHDFSHDFMMSAPGNPIFSETLNLNLQRRHAGASNIYFLGPQTYLHGVMKAMFGYSAHIESGSIFFNEIRSMLEETDFIETYREVPPLHTIIYRPESKQIDFDFNNEKKTFYQQQNVRYWTNEW